MRIQRWMALGLVLCVAVCVFVAELQYGMSSTIAGQAQEITRSAVDQLRVWAIYGDGALLTDEIAALPSVAAVAAERVPDFCAGSISMVKNGVLTEISPMYRIIPVQAPYFYVRGAGLAAGRFLYPGESDAVAVAGFRIAQRMGWGIGSAVSHHSMIGTYRIVGVLSPGETYDPAFTVNQVLDDVVFVPFDRPAVPIPRQAALYAEAAKGFTYSVLPKTGMVDRCYEELNVLLARLKAERGYWYSVEARPVQTVLKTATDNFARSFLALTYFIFVVATAAFSSVFLARVTSRAKEIGVRRALGMSGETASRELMSEALLLTAAGVAAATLLYFLTYRLFGITWQSSGFPGRQLLPLVGLSLLLGPIGVIVPASVAFRLSPMTSIRDAFAWGTQRRSLDLRQVFALAALGLAVAAVCFATSLGLSTVDKVDRLLRSVGAYDIEVQAADLGTVSSEQYARLRQALPGGVPSVLVNSTTAIWSPNGTDWTDVSIIGYEGDIAAGLGYSGVPATGVGSDEAAIGVDLARSLGDNVVGTTVKIGYGELPFSVVGLLDPRPRGIYDRGSDRDQTIVMGMTGFSTVADRSPSVVSRVVVHCPDSTSADEVESAVEAALGSEVTLQRPFSSLQALRQLRAGFSAFIVLGSIALSLAVAVAVGVIMIARAWETRRSMAIHIAVGATSRQMAVASGWDMAKVTLLATLGGVTLGFIGCLLFGLAAGLPVQVSIDGSLLTASFGLTIAGALGAACYLFFRGKSVAQYLHE